MLVDDKPGAIAQPDGAVEVTEEHYGSKLLKDHFMRGHSGWGEGMEEFGWVQPGVAIISYSVRAEVLYLLPGSSPR